MIKCSLFVRFYRYTKERFNLLQFCTLSALLGLLLGFGTQLRLGSSFDFGPPFFGSVALFLFFLRLRIFDEFKDHKHDKQYYPTRPVSRGLITLAELRPFLLPIIFLEFGIAALFGKLSLLLFVISLSYSFLMLKEFFVRDWLRHKFTTYVFVHELLAVPLFIYIATINGFSFGANDWFFTSNLVVLSTSLLFLLEVSRKVRPKRSEVASNDTYTAQYGIAGASILVATVATVAFASMTVNLILLDALKASPIIISITMLAWLFYSLFLFLKNRDQKSASNVFGASIIYFALVSISTIGAMLAL